ncbi:FG-GAP repeat domain-containing protein [Actinacidiphila bryophytorum]|uniref:FG-GAP repeat domain-containing protein n=1 Tax=Actinacidiphila bryophytorum TaxID=1436133 RepID=UPI002176B777|nr:VCBS repeat-containing protein [Actinacidiphila bryophytorum]UWE07678.1 VCBS repeat-containing protein [Actinacidiphila bryophytorum]
MARSASRALRKGSATRGGLALALTCALAAPFLGTAVPASAETAPAAYDVVVPPLGAPRLLNDTVVLATATGYLRTVADGSPTWVPYDGGAPVTVGANSPQFAVRLPDGTERLASLWNGTLVRLNDPATGKAEAIYLPTSVAGVVAATGTPDGWAMVGYTRTGANVSTYHLFQVTGTTVTSDTVLTGIPTEGVVLKASTPTAESGGPMLVSFDIGGRRGVSLVDPSTGSVDTVPDFTPDDGAHQVVTTADSIGWYAAGTLHLASLGDPGTETRTITLPPELGADTTAYAVALTDSALLAVRSGSAWNDGRTDPLYSVPLTGGHATELLPDAADLQIAEDGGAVVRGGPDAAHWSAYRILPGGGAPAELFHIRVLTPVRYGLTLAQGELGVMEGTPDADDHLASSRYFQNEGVGPVPQPADTPHTFPYPRPPRSCDAQYHCTTGMVMGSGAGGAAYVDRSADGKDVVYLEGSAVFGGVPLDSTGGHVVDASENFVVYDSGSNGKQYVVKPNGNAVVLTRPIAPAALWGDTLWTASATKGKVDQTDLRSRSTAGPVARASVTTDAPCAIKEVQALATWLYWSCGPSGPAGVYDRTAGKSVAVPAGPALLGDGFVLRHPGGELQVTDSRTGATRTVAQLPAEPELAGGDRRVTWTVDKFRGQIAYIAPDAAIHLIPSGTVPSALSGQDQFDVPTSFESRMATDWEISLMLSGPVASWKLQFRPAAGGAPVSTTTGGAERSEIATGWSGRDSAGHYLPVGRYAWTLTAPPASGIGPALVRTGTVDVHHGLALPHDYSDDGIGDLLGMTPTGRLDVRPGNGSGTVLPAALQSSRWPTGSRYVAIGDLAGIGSNDLLVRSPAGVLTRYNGTGTFPVIATSSPHLAIGAGWNIYNALTSPGDLTGDGRPDLVARDAAGVLWRYDGTAAGSLASRVRICAGWQGYNLLAGDPAGGLLARDTAGVLWRYSPNGKGGLLNRVRLGGGWQGYTSLTAPGDLTRDGRPDLLARDPAGVLWRYNGDGKGSYLTPRVRLGAGWQMYTTLL